MNLAVAAFAFALLAKVFDPHIPYFAFEASSLPQGRHRGLEGRLGSGAGFLGAGHIASS